MARQLAQRDQLIEGQLPQLPAVDPLQLVVHPAEKGITDLVVQRRYRLAQHLRETLRLLALGAGDLLDQLQRRLELAADAEADQQLGLAPLQRLMEGFQEQQGVFVPRITSYNVCYTKLLRRTS